MNLDLGSFAFGSSLRSGTGTPSWGTALGQSKPDYKFTYPGAEAILIGMIYCSVPLDTVSLPLGKGGRIYQASDLSECQLASLFHKVYINGIKIGYPFVLVLVKENSDSHSGRKSIKYSDKNAYKSGYNQYSNQEFLRQARIALGLSEDACWFIYSFEIYNQDELHMSAVIVDKDNSITYQNSSERRNDWIDLIPEDKVGYSIVPSREINTEDISAFYRPFITAIKSKPFLLLAGISGTGKSRIVRELARACWDVDSDEYKAQKPRNFEMVQVKPNWHDSSELIGYVSRIDGVRYVVGPFLRFMVKAMQDPETPYFLCLDEMNLAPVEQYFAEYLSVIESRKVQEDGTITTDPIVDYSNTEEYISLIQQLFPDDDLRKEYQSKNGGKRLSIPNNLIVVGTVNMDETTFSFSRKVLDRAMTIEMNKVELDGGLDQRYEKIGKLGAAELIGNAVEGVDVYSSYKDVCDTAIAYLQGINDKLEGTPFKIAYRTRNEVLLYVVNNLPYDKIEGDDESTYKEEFVIARALDEITNMKILSRIEGDESKVNKAFLDDLGKAIKDCLETVFEEIFDEDDEDVYTSVSLAKLDEMKKRLDSGYTSFWS